MTDSCLHRAEVRRTDSDEVATCELLRQISGVNDRELARVSRDACDACCESFEPSTTDLNPILASHLFCISEAVISSGGVDGCSLERGKELNLWAEKSLPAVAPDEDDSIDLGRQVRLDHHDVSVDQITRHLPRPSEVSRIPVTSWMVGITTAPRRLPTLEQSIESVIGAGWQDPVLFIDGDLHVPDSMSDLDFCHHKPATGAFPNYVLSLCELYMRNPNADAYLLMQDDAVIFSSTATREYVESVLWPIDGPCIASLYCSAKYSKEESGWHQFEGNWVWGAVAFVFSPEAIKLFLTSMEVFNHRAQPDDKGLSRIDVVIGNVARANGIPMYYPTPSLVQHIGTISTIWKTGRAVNARRADQFLGDLIDPV